MVLHTFAVSRVFIEVKLRYLVVTHPSYFVFSTHISQGRVVQTIEHTKDFLQEMCDSIWNLTKLNMVTKKQLLHYVIRSEQLKLSTNWRPDNIPNHVASLVQQDSVGVTLGLAFLGDHFAFHARIDQEFNDVLGVRLTGYKGLDIDMQRECRPRTNEPAILNGRLVYKSAIPVDGNHIYLYWDGHQRWVVSPSEESRGQPAPYGLNKEEPFGFVWVKDSRVALPRPMAQNRTSDV